MTVRSIISGTGSVLPEWVVPNSYFHDFEFHDVSGALMQRSGIEITEKLEAITGIKERRYVPLDQDSVPLMTEASRLAVESSGIAVNDLSGIIVAHNAGNMVAGIEGFHTVPNLASMLKNALNCTNHECFAYDVLFGCPGWVQAMIQAHQTIRCGDAEHILVTGVEVLSRMLDPHDVDSMILSDGCGACVVSRSDDESKGIVSYTTYSHAQEDNRIIYLGDSNKKDVDGSCYFHMNGREVYKYATRWVPEAIKSSLEKADIGIEDVDIFLFHQANAKMLSAMTKRLAEVCGVEDDLFSGKIPSTIEFLGNSSVATIPTMLDMVLKGELEGFKISPGDVAVMASVGAGMHCNSLVYRF